MPEQAEQVRTDSNLSEYLPPPTETTVPYDFADAILVADDDIILGGLEQFDVPHALLEFCFEWRFVVEERSSRASRDRSVERREIAWCGVRWRQRRHRTVQVGMYQGTAYRERSGTSRMVCNR